MTATSFGGVKSHRSIKYEVFVDCPAFYVKFVTAAASSECSEEIPRCGNDKGP
jgi:hypothetical protein